MSWIYLFFVAALDLTGIFFNVRMLRCCFKDATKYTFLQQHRSLTISQCICQVTLLVMDVVESWKGFDTQPRESCNVLRMLPISIILLLACNIMVLYFDHHTTLRHQGASFKSKVTAALCLGFVGAVAILSSCFCKDFLFQIVIRGIAFVVLTVHVLLYAAASTDINVQHDNAAPEDSKKTCSLLWNVCKQNKGILLFYCLASSLLIFSNLPRIFLIQDFEQTKDLIELVYPALATTAARLITGIILPAAFIYLIDSSYEENEIKTVVI